MSSNRCIHEDHYSSEGAFVRAKVAIVNLETGRQTTLHKVFLIDTGFDGGIHVSRFHEAEITGIGVFLSDGNYSLAGGRSESVKRCLAYLQRLGSYEFPAPGIEVELILHGRDNYGLLGLGVLNRWIVNFDGPKEFFRIKHPEE